MRTGGVDEDGQDAGDGAIVDDAIEGGLDLDASRIDAGRRDGTGDVQRQIVDIAGIVAAGAEGDPALGHAVPHQLRLERTRHGGAEVAGHRGSMLL